MREILFRAKRIDNGEWVEGYYQRQYDVFEKIRHLIYWTKDHLNWEYFDVDPETVCQYIEKGDINKKKIYEGYIVRNFLCIDDHGEKLYEVGIVAYDEETLGFSVFDNENNRLNISYMGNIEVIGNKFDNPELMEE